MKHLLWLRHGEPGPEGLSGVGRLQIGKVASLLPPVPPGQVVHVIHSGAPRARATAETLLAHWQPPASGLGQDTRVWSGPDRQGDAPFLEDDLDRLPAWLQESSRGVDFLVVVTHFELCADVLPLLAACCDTSGRLPSMLDRGQAILFNLATQHHAFLDGRDL